MPTQKSSRQLPPLPGWTFGYTIRDAAAWLGRRRLGFISFIDRHLDQINAELSKEDRIRPDELGIRRIPPAAMEWIRANEGRRLPIKRA